MMGKGPCHRERWEENIMVLGAYDKNLLQRKETGPNIRS